MSATGQQCLSSRGAGSRASEEDGEEAGSRASTEDGAGAGEQESRGHGRHRQRDSWGKKSSQQWAQRAQRAGARRAWGTTIPEPPTPPRGSEQGADPLISGQMVGELVKKQLEGSVGGERRQSGTDEQVWGLS